METRLEFVLDLSGLDLALAEIKTGVVAGLDAEGQATVADMRQRAPVSPDGSHGNQPGFMRDSTSYEVDRDLPSLTLQATAPYSGFVDQGTRFMAAQPWWTPALDQMTVRLPETMARTINEALR